MNLPTAPEEAEVTIRARQILKDIYKPLQFEIDEEYVFEEVTNYIGESMDQFPYRGDMLFSKVFVIELDSRNLHGTHRRIVHDKWKKINIWNQRGIPLVRLLSKDVVKQDKKDIIKEINSQLSKQQQT